MNSILKYVYFLFFSGICFFHLGEFDRAHLSLTKALKILNLSPSKERNKVENSPNNHNNNENLNVSIGNVNIINGGNSDDLNSPMNNNERSAVKNKESEGEIKKDETEIYKLKEKQKILSFIAKTEKSLEVQKINELKQKKAMQKVFSSGAILGEKKRIDKSDNKSKIKTLNNESQTYDPPCQANKKNVKMKTFVFNFFAYLFRLIVQYFSSMGSKKRKTKNK